MIDRRGFLGILSALVGGAWMGKKKETPTAAAILRDRAWERPFDAAVINEAYGSFDLGAPIEAMRIADDRLWFVTTDGVWYWNDNAGRPERRR